MISSLQSMNTAMRPNFLLLKEICATVLSLDTYIDTKIQLHYDADCILRATQHYQSGRMTSALTYRSNTLDPRDMIVYGADGQVVENHTYSYDEDGKLITITGADAAGTVVFSKNHCYDRKGMLDYFEVHRNGKLHYWESYRNDQFGLRDSFVSGDGAGNLLRVIQYQNIMENGKLAKIITLRNGEICRTVSYGENGKPLLESHAHCGEEVYRVEYRYDEAGMLVEIRRFRYGQLEQNTKYIYLNGCLQGYESYLCGQLDAQYSYIYEPVRISDAQASVLSGLYAKLVLT